MEDVTGTNSNDTALAIYQIVLDSMGRAVVSGDADGFLKHIFLPCRLETESKTFEIESAQDAARHFEGFAGALAAQRVDAYVRIARDARFDTDDRITGRHDTMITSNGMLVVPRFANEMTLLRQGGVWGTNRVRHKVKYVSWPDVLPRPGDRK